MKNQQKGQIEIRKREIRRENNDMKKPHIRKQHAGDKNHKMSKDLLKEEFGTELGNFNAVKAFEGDIESKSKNQNKG